MSRRFLLLWWMLSVLTIIGLRTMFDHNTDTGTVVLTIIGTLIAALVAWCAVQLWNAWHRSRELSAWFSSYDFEDAVDKGFARSSISAKRYIQEGNSVIVFGISPGNLVRLLSCDIRPVTRTWLFKWRSLEQPRPITLTKLRVKQLQWRRQFGIDGASNIWHNDHGGFVFHVPLSDYAVLDAHHALWMEIYVAASRDWNGWISFKARTVNGQTLFVRRRLIVRPDHNILMDAPTHN